MLPAPESRSDHPLLYQRPWMMTWQTVTPWWPERQCPPDDMKDSDPLMTWKPPPALPWTLGPWPPGPSWPWPRTWPWPPPGPWWTWPHTRTQGFLFSLHCRKFSRFLVLLVLVLCCWQTQCSRGCPTNSVFINWVNHKFFETPPRLKG